MVGVANIGVLGEIKSQKDIKNELALRLNASEEEDKELRDLKKNKTNTSNQLTLIRNVVYSMLKGYSDLRTEVQQTRMLITTSNGEDLSVTQLSGGYKAIFTLVVDIASRLVLANPKSENPLDCQALILIDELDLHLHPKWQKTIVNDLKTTFPKCQFIVTTHSPFIVQSLNKQEVINLEDDLKDLEDGNYKGWSIDEIQEYEMGVQIKSPEYIKLLEFFEEAINEKDILKAKAIYVKIINMIHPSSNVAKLLKMDMINLGDVENDKD